MAADNSDIYPQYDKASPSERERFLGMLDGKYGPGTSDRFKREYDDWGLEKGATNATQATTPTAQQQQAPGSEVTNAIGSAWLGSQLGGGGGTGTVALTGPQMALPAAAIGMGVGAYNYGGRQALKGEADAGDYTNLFLQANPLTAGINPVLDAVGMGSVGKSLGLGRKTTKQYEADRTNELLGMSDAPEWQEQVQHFRGVEHGPEADDAAFNPQQAIADAKEDGKVLWGTSAVLKQFGPEWFTAYDERQREAITKALAQNDLFYNSKGDWQISDPNRANEIAQETIANMPPPEEAPMPEGQQQAAPEEQQPAQGGGIRAPRPNRPSPVNEIPPLIEPTPPQPTIRTPKDYAQAYLDVYNSNSSLNMGPTSPIRRY